jgi:hypothetical protein
MGHAPELLDDAMNRMKEAIIARNCETKPDLWTKEGGGGWLSVPATGNHIFDAHNTHLLVSDRFASRFVGSPLRLSPLEIALTPHIRVIIEYLSSCLHLGAGVDDHPTWAVVKPHSG